MTARRIDAPDGRTMSYPQIEDALARNAADELIYIPISLSMDPPEEEFPGYAERVCRRLAKHDHPNVRGNAILGFGHLARTAGIIWKPNDVRALVEAGLADPDSYVRGQAETAAGDLRHFLKWKLKKPKQSRI
ncbi:MAG TPA: hypothetical protein PLN33_09780 [Hyphomonadaceae bacterium]|nr:hypothetical protein [Hyphomonadaceae bacterium]HPN04819.1 hypothetical protein [Hyphomonadaceae bacterium]